jgi:hypothetical protein
MAEKEPVFTVLNPRGTIPERKHKGLAPRLDTLEGKTVKFVFLGGGNPNDMTYIYEDFEKKVPECNAVYHKKRSAGSWILPFSDVEFEEVVTGADAIVLSLNF